jgi:nitroreductase
MAKRVFENDILPEIRGRWSPKAFAADRPVAAADLRAILEAASFAPSSMNEQPWLFLVADETDTRQRLLEVLTPRNQTWAFRAPVLMLVLARRTFQINQKENPWHRFDAGTAWGFLSLEAQRRGLVTHAMGGFSEKNAREVFAIPDEIDIIAAVAIGYYGDPAQLSEEQQAREHPSARVPVDEILFKPGLV